MYSHEPKNKKITLKISLIKNQTKVWLSMQVLAIDIDDSKKKSTHEEVIAFCKLGYTSLQNLGKFCIIDHFKNTAFTVVNSLCPKILSMSISKQKSFVY